MNQVERRLFEMLQVLAGERGDKNKRAVRLDEIQELLNKFDNQSIVKAVDAVKKQADEQGVEISEILAELVILNQEADAILAQVDEFTASIQADFDELLIDVDAANTAVTEAQAARDAAQSARDNALASENSAGTFAAQSATSAQNADNAASTATSAASTAANSATQAGNSAAAAASSASAASTSATDASQSASASTAAKVDAETARSQAQTAQTNAASSATDAFNSASSASSSETNAANSANAAGNSASAAASSASTALTAASNAETSATAANTQRIDAETAASNAGVARDQAVAARDSADDAAALAGERLEVTAAITSQGTSVLRDQFLGENNSNHWTRSNSQGSLTRPDNTLYSIGNDWRFVVASGQVDGFETRSTRSNWRGAANADSYVVEVDFTLESGSIAGAGVWLEWRNTAGTTRRVAIPFTDASIGPVVSGNVMTATVLVERPSNFSGTFSENRIYVWANRNDSALGNAAKTIRFHRVSVRVATDAEKRLVEAEANITQEAIARADADQALATDISTVQSNLNGTNAAVSQQATAISTLEGNASATLAFRTKAGTAGAQLELISASDPEGDTSIARIDATNIILNGTVSGTLLQFDQGLFNGLRANDTWIKRAMIEDAAIDSAKIAGTIQSDNFVAGDNGDGWRIQKDGSAQFGTLAMRRGAISVLRGVRGVSQPGSGWTTVASLTFAPFEALDLIVWVSGVLNINLRRRTDGVGTTWWERGGTNDVRVRWRGGVVPGSQLRLKNFVFQFNSSNNYVSTYSNTFIVPSGGSSVGTLELQARRSNSNRNFDSPTLVCSEFKR